MFERMRFSPFLQHVRPLLRVPQVTPARAAAALTGAVAVQGLPELPHVGVTVGLLAASLVALFFRRADRVPLWFVLGFAWTLWHAHEALQQRLPAEWHGRDFLVSGVISDLPDVGADSTRFELLIDSAQLAGVAVDLRGPVQVRWYVGAPTIEPCSRWTLSLRLRPPRGLVNPSGFDGERHAVQRGRVAVGYVRESALNRRDAVASTPCVNGMRRAITQAITDRLGNGSDSALLRALAVGDQSGIADADWHVLRATGIGHLIAISGLHVGLFAAFGAWLARRCWKAWPTLTLRAPGPMIEAPAAMLFALGYGLLAGMGLPTVRTLLMIGVALLARHSRRSTSVAQALALAAMAILLWDPLAVLAAGFWLSFGGVAILLTLATPVGDERPAWRDMPRVQWMLSIALVPLTIWFFGQASLVGPLANLLAVPWISFVVVPVTVTASLLITWLPSLGAPLLDLAAFLLMALWSVMQWMAALPMSQHYFAQAPAWTFALALVGVGWSLLPRGVPLRGFGMLLALPMLLPARMPLVDGEFEVWMFDVGQGLSVLVRTRDHALLYDTGPRYPSGFDVGEAVIIPALHALSVRTLDRIIVSHGDNDHAGGTRALALAYPYASVLAGEPDRLDVPSRGCVAGESWRWDGVDVRVVSPPAQSRLRGNDRSCVLVVSSSHGSVVLTGDISSAIEPAVIDALGTLPRPLLASVAHHGSRTSSSAAFVDTVDPDLAWISAGFRNRFGHPHAEVLARFDAGGVALANTADAGYLGLRFSAQADTVVAGRVARDRWWRLQ